MTNPNDPTFPLSGELIVNAAHPDFCGLTKREYFAAMLASHQPYEGAYLTPEQSKQGQQDWAHNVISNADALIAELSKEVKA